MTTRYIVLHWKQPGSVPLALEDVFTKLVDAQAVAHTETSAAQRSGQPDTFTVHEVNMDAVTS